MQIVERRTTVGKVSASKGASATGNGTKISGYGAVVNRRSEVLTDKDGPFVEVILPGAFSDVLKNDVRALVNHNPNFVLARSKNGAGTLKLSVDATGLLYQFDADPEQSYARDLIIALKRGDVDQSSFAFSIAKNGDAWTKLADGTRLREIRKLGALFDVSIVAYPGYTDTLASVRHGSYAAQAEYAPIRDALAVELGVRPLRGDVAARLGIY